MKGQDNFLLFQTTDFIFSVIGEELGFIFSGAVIILYVVMITKAIKVAKTAKNDLGSYIAVGIARYIFISYDREYRNDYGIATNNWSSTSFCKLWRNVTDHAYGRNRNSVKHL